MNDWSKVLLACKRGMFPNYYYGLTIRFIVGACQTPIGRKFETPKKAYSSTKQLFNELESYKNSGLVVTSNRCDIHKAPVMQFSEDKGKYTESIGTSFDELWGCYGNDIIAGNYNISPEDLETLEKLFNT